MSKTKINLTDRRPVTIEKDLWPVIAKASNHDGAVECQANHEWFIRVRQHQDGRSIVYAGAVSGNGGTPAGFRPAYAGEVLEAGDSIEDAIHRVGSTAGCEHLISEAIDDLPAEELN